MGCPSSDGRAIPCYTVGMDYRTIEIHWMPRDQAQWGPFVLSRKEAARLWADLVERHHRLRRLRWRWPSKARWQKWAKGRYPGLSAQAVQQIIGEFCEAVNATRQLRKNGYAEARYPWKKPRYRDVVYTNQDARIRDGRLVLPNGRSGHLRIRLPGAKARRRITDLVHKATRQVSDTFPGATCYVGEPFNDAAQDMAPRQAQTVSQACNARIIGQLDYKTCGALQVNEAYSSQTCPMCGRRRTCRRMYRCRCGIVAPRD